MAAVDLLVLGAGPAGCAAAIVGARAGLRVVVVERSTGPRDRPGETLHPGVEPLLGRLGALDAVSAAGFVRHEGTYVEWGGPRSFEPFGRDEAGPWLGMQAVRRHFDEELLRVAGTAGAEVRRGDSVGDLLIERGRVVGARCRSGELRSSLLVDAMGDRHRLARGLGIRVRRDSPELRVRFGYMTGRCRERDDAPLIAADEGGWTWTARIAGRSYQWTRLDLHARTPASWRPREFACLTDVGPVRGADVTWRMAERVAGDGYFLVGDAAAVLDPASSHGVLRALMSGMMAGHLASRVVNATASSVDASVQYQAWFTDWYRRDLARMRRSYRAQFGWPMRLPSG